jgi:hypothetical protein
MTSASAVRTRSGAAVVAKPAIQLASVKATLLRNAANSQRATPAEIVRAIDGYVKHCTLLVNKM